MKDYNEVKQEATALNTAFVEAFVSYSSYDSRRWMIERSMEATGNPVLNAFKQANTTAEQLTSKKVFELYASLFIKHKFTQIDLNLPKNGTYQSKKYGFDTTFNCSTGDFETLNNLARAAIVTSNNPDGTKTLHLSFRGTDTDARTFKNFVTDAYLDMSAYYDSFKPLETAVLEYASDPANKITKINVSGHSLGGAMVPEFFNSSAVRKCKIPMEGVTYGAPGNIKKPFYSLLPAIYHGIKHGKFLELGKTIVSACLDLKTISRDNRITQYSHIGDLIPRVAALVYEKEGKNVTLEDIASNNKTESFILSGKSPADFINQKSVQTGKNIEDKVFVYKHTNFWDQTKAFFHKAITFQFHDMLRYIINIDNQAQNLVKLINQQTDVKLKEVLIESTPDIIDFHKYREKFDKVADFNETILGASITQRFTARLKTSDKEKGVWGGQISHHKHVASRVVNLRQMAFSTKVFTHLEQEFTKTKPT